MATTAATAATAAAAAVDLVATTCSPRSPQSHVASNGGGAVLSSGWQLVATVLDGVPFSFQKFNIIPRVLDGGRALQLTATFHESDFTQQAKKKKAELVSEVEARERDAEMSLKQVADIQERLARAGYDDHEVDEEAGMDMVHLLATVRQHRREIARLKAVESVTLTYSECSTTHTLQLDAGRLTHVPREFFESLPLIPVSSEATPTCAPVPAAGSAHEAVLCWMWVPSPPCAAVPAQLQTEKDERKVSRDLPVSQLSPGTVLKYVSNFDVTGLFHYLGTARCTKPWCNPVTSGVVRVTSSAVPSNYENLFSKLEPCAMYGFPSWICVDLGADITIANVTHYSLRGYSESNLRSWRLEGSLNGSKWKLLKEHVDDASINDIKQGPIHFSTWRLPGTSAPARFLRIMSTGPYSNRGDWLLISGLEVYGCVMTE